MGIADQHLQSFVPGYGPDLHQVQIGIFKEAAGGLMAEVMETQVFQSGFAAGREHGIGDLVRSQAKNPLLSRVLCIGARQAA